MSWPPRARAPLQWRPLGWNLVVVVAAIYRLDSSEVLSLCVCVGNILPRLSAPRGRGHSCLLVSLCEDGKLALSRGSKTDSRLPLVSSSFAPRPAS